MELHNVGVPVEAQHLDLTLEGLCVAVGDAAAVAVGAEHLDGDLAALVPPSHDHARSAAAYDAVVLVQRHIHTQLQVEVQVQLVVGAKHLERRHGACRVKRHGRATAAAAAATAPHRQPQGSQDVALRACVGSAPRAVGKRGARRRACRRHVIERLCDELAGGGAALTAHQVAQQRCVLVSVAAVAARQPHRVGGVAGAERRTRALPAALQVAQRLQVARAAL
mmetsp:Transcript_29766/g.88107  ORF Transcript_29766/g.88107 Transcript_29766/m.88107 type:complete len:223 (+) Transcript_29766:2079-2747(+)